MKTLNESSHAAWLAPHGGSDILEYKLARQAPSATPDEKPGVLVENFPPQKTRDQVAKPLGVTGRSIQTELAVKRGAPDLHDEVKTGKMSVHAAGQAMAKRKGPQSKPKSTRSGWNDHRALLVVDSGDEQTIQVADIPLYDACVRFLSLSLRGDAPAPAVVPSQIIVEGLTGVIEAVKKAWPAARKVIVSTLNDAPQGWEAAT